MRYLFGPAGRAAVREIVRPRTLLAFDFDGTLAPIVDDPAEAKMRRATRDRLARLAALCECVVVSGRARADLLPRLDGVGLAEVIGNHGIEPWHTSERAVRVVRTWHRQLERRLGRLDGVVVEDKTYSISVHYRRATDKRTARAAVRDAAAALHGARVIAGKRSVSLVPEFAPDKGIAVGEASRRFGCATAVFVGDDTTDEDVFGRGEPGRLLTVRVRRRHDSAASYYIRNQAEIDRLLGCLVARASGRPCR